MYGYKLRNCWSIILNSSSKCSASTSIFIDRSSLWIVCVCAWTNNKFIISLNMLECQRDSQVFWWMPECAVRTNLFKQRWIANTHFYELSVDLSAYVFLTSICFVVVVFVPSCLIISLAVWRFCRLCFFYSSFIRYVHRVQVAQILCDNF